MMVHLRADPLTFAPELREIATAVDPTLRLSEVQRVDQVTEVLIWVVRLWLRVTLVMTAVALMLALSGIYAVLSFVVARRTRDIGIRVALGADRRRVISAIFRRPLIQVGLGVLAGNALLALAGSVETDMPGNRRALSWATDEARRLRPRDAGRVPARVHRADAAGPQRRADDRPANGLARPHQERRRCSRSRRTTWPRNSIASATAPR
ncbi:MAG: hypothetical protein H0X67_09145 [Acidobacteria bacterium]|nr:hypothetical protein [Acidobacteriota bacterium]